MQFNFVFPQTRSTQNGQVGLSNENHLFNFWQEYMLKYDYRTWL